MMCFWPVAEVSHMFDWKKAFIANYWIILSFRILRQFRVSITILDIECFCTCLGPRSGFRFAVNARCLRPLLLFCLARWQWGSAGVAEVPLWACRASRGHVPPFSWITGFLLHPTRRSRHLTPLQPAPAQWAGERAEGGTCGSINTRCCKNLIGYFGIRVFLAAMTWVCPCQSKEGSVFGNDKTIGQNKGTLVCFESFFEKRLLGDAARFPVCVAWPCCPAVFSNRPIMCVRHVTGNFPEWFLNTAS